ncbi:MAG: Npt1/Npt2 family nucleotide transporter [Clostridia bacterium]|nr:Npt1/Npt2 family nucleotide transporter [Clostridia bacterium]
MVKFLMSLCKFNFGEFEEKEFRKFLRMGSILTVILGIYYMMRPLKDSLFAQLVGAEYQPYAKFLSVLFIGVVVAVYTKLLDYFPKHKLLCVLPPLFYGTITLSYAAFIWAYQGGIIKESLLTVIMGYLFYCVVESFGSIVVALFWSFSTDITKSEAAKTGFPLVYMIGQLGTVFTPILFINLPMSLGFGSDAISMALVGIFTFLIAPLVNHLYNKTPSDLMESQSPSKVAVEPSEKKKKTGFIEGLRLLFSHKYLIGILAVNFFFEFIAIVFDFNFKSEASKVYSGAKLTEYYSTYNAVLGAVALAFLLLGVSRITKKLGLKKSLACIPVFFGIAITGFLSLTLFGTLNSYSLDFLFWLMVSSKAIHYSINGPSLKQLYIPTSADVRSKTQAWIETFGARFSKQSGSTLNLLNRVIGMASYRLLSSCIGYVFVAAWFFVALYLGKTHKNATESGTNVC